jgi:high-affinity iron transporter
MLGIQPRPVVVEVIGWLVYLIPVGCYVAWPPGRAVPGRGLARACAGVGVLAGLGALVLTLIAPSRPDSRPTTSAAGIAATMTARSATDAVVQTTEQQPVAGTTGRPIRVELGSLGSVRHRGLRTEVFRATVAGATGADGRPGSLTLAQVATLNNGHLPIGIPTGTAALAATYRDARTLTVWLDTRTDRVVDLSWSESVTATARSGNRVFPLSAPAARATVGLPKAAVDDAVAAARRDHTGLDHRSVLATLAMWCAVLAAGALLAAAGFGLAARRRSETPAAVTSPAPSLIGS